MQDGAGPARAAEKGFDHLVMKIALIAAMDNNRVIGANNVLPWHLPVDLKHFKTITLGKPILMGRKTYESIGRPLPGRDNIVLTRQADFGANGCTVACSMEQAVSHAAKLGAKELMVIGGGQLYEAMLPSADRLYLTLVDTSVAGDAFFPEIDGNEWAESDRQEHAADEKNAYNVTFLTLDRIAP